MKAPGMSLRHVKDSSSIVNRSLAPEKTPHSRRMLEEFQMKLLSGSVGVDGGLFRNRRRCFHNFGRILGSFLRCVGGNSCTSVGGCFCFVFVSQEP